MMSQQIVGERTRLDQHDLVNCSIGQAIDNWPVWHGCLAEARLPVSLALERAGLNRIADVVRLALFQAVHNVVDNNSVRL
jgi:hypothetical protein